MEIMERAVTRYNYYDILEVDPLSPQHEVTVAYERARCTYSGENPAVYTIFSESEAREMLRLVEEAYSVIGNKALRSLYDEKLVSGGIRQEEVSHQSLESENRSRSLAASPPKRPRVFQVQYPIDEKIEAEITARTDWNGEALKKVREYKQVSLEKMSEVTKISAFYLNALEALEPGQLPAKVFVRGYVAQVCRVLGLNEKTVCDSYMNYYQKKI